MKKYDTVIFDLDGTLLNTLEDLRDGVNYVLRKFEYPERSLEEIRSFVGNGIERLMERAVPNGKENPRFTELFEDFKEYYTAHCRIKTNPYDGIMELLENLASQGYKLAIVSNKNHAAVNSLNAIYFSNVVKTAIGEREGIRKKPAPDTVLEALHELGSTKESSVYVGDSEVDKQTADNASMDCVLVSWGFRDKDKLEALCPNRIIDKPVELLDYLEM